MVEYLWEEIRIRRRGFHPCDKDTVFGAGRLLLPMSSISIDWPPTTRIYEPCADMQSNATSRSQRPDSAISDALDAMSRCDE